jgi:oxygen-independent coproporphyrinogen-3 oxidase
MNEVDEKQSLSEYALIEKELCGAGYEHYEVSNYALPGYRSRHNSSYWQGVQYLGVGPGAHSFNGEQRRWCSQMLPAYIAERKFEGEILSEKDHFNEYIMTSLRRAEGLDLDFMTKRFGAAKVDALLDSAKSWIAEGDLELSNRRLFIPTERFMISDAVIESFFE